MHFFHRSHRDLSPRRKTHLALLMATSVAAISLLPSNTADAAVFRTVTLSGAAIPDTTGSTATANGVSFGTTTVNSNPFSSVTTNAAGRVAFQSALVGTGAETVDATNNNGIWSEGSGILKKVQRENDAAPGPTGAPLSDFTFNSPVTTGPNLNSAGNVALGGTMKGTGLDTVGADSNHQGLFSNSSGGLKMAVRFQDAAVGTIYQFQPSTSPPVMNSSGLIAFLAVVTDGTSTYPSGTGSNGIWKVDSAGTVTKVAALGDAAADTTGGLYYGTSSFGAPVMNSSGSIAFAARLAAGGDVVTGTNDFGIWSDASGTMKLVARRGGAANGTTGAMFSLATTSPPLGINNAGTVAFIGNLTGGDVSGSTNDQGLWKGDEQSNLALVVRKGSQAADLPAGVNYNVLAGLALNKNGNVAFNTSLIGGGIGTTNDTAIFTETAGGIDLIAQEGAAAPGGDVFLNVGSGVPIQNNAANHVAFRATLAALPGGATTGTGLFAQNEAGLLELIVKTGQSFEAAPADFRTVADVIYGSISSFYSGGEDGRISSWNDYHQIGFSLRFTDGTSGVFVATVPEPASAAVILGSAGLLARRRNRGVRR